MKVNLGPFRGDLIPVHSWERSYEYWRRPETCYLPEEEYTRYDKIVFGFFEWLDKLVRPINRWSNRRPRKIEIHVDYYDVWGLDHTLGMIIAPALKKLKEHQHGYPHVDNEDVPESLHMTNEQKEALNWDGTVDANHEARWNYVLNEMIWAFEQHADPDGGTNEFYHNTDQLDMLFKPLADKPGYSGVEFNHQKDPTKPAYWRDDEGLNKHAERKKNGRRLFAKYYESLWD